MESSQKGSCFILCPDPLQVVINPNYEVPESDFSNNIMKCRSRYDGYRIWMYNCHVGKFPRRPHPPQEARTQDTDGRLPYFLWGQRQRIWEKPGIGPASDS